MSSAPTAIENRPGGLVAGFVGSAGMLLPRMYPPWLLRTMAEDLEAMVTMFLSSSLRMSTQSVLRFASLSVHRPREERDLRFAMYGSLYAFHPSILLIPISLANITVFKVRFWLKFAYCTSDYNFCFTKKASRVNLANGTQI